jgi:hypothetical protein
MKDIDMPAMLIPTGLILLGLVIGYFAGLFESPIYPDIQPEYIQQMSREEKRILSECQTWKADKDKGLWKSLEHSVSVMRRTDTLWEEIYLMYKDGYWCNRFERYAYAAAQS